MEKEAIKKEKEILKRVNKKRKKGDDTDSEEEKKVDEGEGEGESDEELIILEDQKLDQTDMYVIRCIYTHFIGILKES